MTNMTRLLLASAAATALAGAAVAQDAVFANSTAATDTVDDIQEAVQEDFKRETNTFGNSGRALGWNGSVSGRATLSDGNSNSFDMGIGARLGYFDGVNGHKLNLSYAYSESETAGTTTVTKDQVLAGYDYTREIGSNTFVFGKAMVNADKFDSYKLDAFVGAGLGYRIYNDADTQWSVQAGPGYRYAENNAGEKVLEETALSVSSDFYKRLTDTVFITNDTDILASENATSVINELGLNVAMSDALALRTSLTSEWDDNPIGNFKASDNTLGVAVVYSFN